MIAPPRRIDKGGAARPPAGKWLTIAPRVETLTRRRVRAGPGPG